MSDVALHLIQFSPNFPASFRHYPHLTVAETRLKEVSCADLETLLVSSKAEFDPRPAPCLGPAHSTVLPPLLRAGPLPLQWVTS